MFATRMIAGSSGAATQTLCGRSARAIRRVTIACSSRSLSEREQLLAEVGVDGRVGRAAGRAGERDRRGAQALAAHQQLRRGADEGAVAAADAVDVAGVEARAQDAEDRRRVVRRRARGRRPRGRARSSRTRRRGSARRRARRRPRSARAARSRRSGSGRPAPGRAAAAARSRSSASRRSIRRDELVGHVVGRGEDAHREPHVAAAAGERQLGHDQVGGAEAAPVRRRRAVGREREAADGDQAGAGRAVRGRRRRRRPASRRQAAATVRSAVGAAALEARDRSRARRAPRRRGRAAPSRPRRRRAAGTRTRPRSGRPRGRRARSAPAATPSPARRARRTARSQRFEQLRAGRAVQRQPAISGPRLHAAGV